MAAGIFANSAEHKSGWDMYDAAVLYFGAEYLESLVDSIGYRQIHSEILSPFTAEEAQARADMYERLFGQVLVARQILEAQYPELLQLMLDKQYASKTDYVQVLADVLASTSSWKLVTDPSSEDFEYECYSTVQWLCSWLQNETEGLAAGIDQQG